MPKNQRTQRKLLKFENWCNGEGIQKLMLSKNVNNNSSMKKKLKKIQIIFDIEN